VAIPLLPDAARDWMHVLAWLCLGNILYIGLVAMRQRDLNLLIGNSSVAHMGFAFLGIASLSLIGITGTVVIMVAHGFLAALTFALSGYLLHHTKTLEMSQMGGLLRRLPFVGAAFVMAALAGCGVPGFANFAGEILVFFGAWNPLRLVTILAAWGALIIGAVYMLRAVRTIFHGAVDARWDGLRDASDPWRRLPFALLLGGLLLFGIAPRLLTDRARPVVQSIVNRTAPRNTAQVRQAPHPQGNLPAVALAAPEIQAPVAGGDPSAAPALFDRFQANSR
jgi:NADH-quinone oxidoreductase subunit M